MMKEIVLKSCNPEEYPDEVVSCRVIQNADINAYLETIPEERKVVATKTAPVEARAGRVGEKVDTVLYTERNSRLYILSEESNTVGEREVDGQMLPDVVVTNSNSTSNESYVVKANKFGKLYDPSQDGTWVPVPDARQLCQVDEDVVIITAWGSEAVCLKGSYIVVYDASQNDFNTLEQGAKTSTYSDVKPSQKVRK